MPDTTDPTTEAATAVAAPPELNIVLRGQSNAEILAMQGQAPAIQREVQWLLGFDGVTHKVNLIDDYGNSDGNNTINSGTAFIGDWVTQSSDGTWSDNSLETGLLNDLRSQPADVKAAPTAIVWLHNEYDSTNQSLTTAQWTSAVQFDAQQVRAVLGQGAGTTPYLFVNAIPYGEAIDRSNQAIKLGMEELSLNPAFNARIAAQNNDVNMDAWNSDAQGNPIYGGPHMDQTDASQLVDRLARSIADSFASYAQPGSPIALAGGHLDELGPQAVQASPVAGQPDQLLVDVAYDNASGLEPLGPAAASGVGWSVRDASGTVNATAAQVVDGDHLLLTFNGAVPDDGQATLFYGYGYGRLAPDSTTPDGNPGEGNAIYDDQGLPMWTAGTGVLVGAPAQAPGGGNSGNVTPPPAPVSAADAATPAGTAAAPGVGDDATAPITSATTAAAASPSFATTGSAVATSGQTLWSAPGTDVLVGGQGGDSFFVDATSQDGWAEVQNFHAGDIAALLGVDWSKATWSWTQATDPDGQSGATLDISLDGSGTPTMAVTFAGVSMQAAQQYGLSSDSYNGQPFLAVRA